MLVWHLNSNYVSNMANFYFELVGKGDVVFDTNSVSPPSSPTPGLQIIPGTFNLTLIMHIDKIAI